LVSRTRRTPLLGPISLDLSVDLVARHWLQRVGPERRSKLPEASNPSGMEPVLHNALNDLRLKQPSLGMVSSQIVWERYPHGRHGPGSCVSWPINEGQYGRYPVAGAIPIDMRRCGRQLS
jgi:hypothetical protein